MNYSDFIDAVASRAGVSSAEATAITRATLETLADRFTAGMAGDLAGQLPVELRQHLHKTTTAPRAQIAEAFGFEEFCRRTGARAGVEVALVSPGVRAVLTTVGDAVSGEELDRMRSQLPKEFWEMIQPGARVEVPRGR